MTKTVKKYKQIRESLGHNGVECRVRIKRDGSILRYGSPDPFDRSCDYWHFIGHVHDIDEYVCTNN